MIFVDTNYFARYLIGDVPAQHKEAKDLFERGSEREVKLFTSTVVIFEVFWVFTDYYKKTKKEIIDILTKILSMDFVELEEREIIRAALELYNNENIELEDCYNLTYSRSNNMTKFATFDKKLSKII